MKRTLILLAIVALALPATAAAKGPSGASIDGPGTGGGIDLSGSLGPGTELGDFTTWSGFYPAVFRQTPDPMLDSRPEGDLGPKYTVTYTVPGPNGETWKIKQDLYPYVKRGPITYMEPGQEIFETEGTRGGWYLAEIALKDLLVKAGLPATPPTNTSADDSAAVSVGTVLLLSALAALLVLATALVLRRRARPAAA
jgi:MYXO-CTERM domain-containing protein